MKSILRRPTLLLVFAVLCQGILAVHNAQHAPSQPSTCSVCQAHLPQISGEPNGDLAPPPLFTVVAFAPRRADLPDAARSHPAFHSRAPPESLT